MSISPFGANRFTATNVTLESLVQLAYGVPYDQSRNGDKFRTDHFDVTAKAEDGVLLSREELQPRLRRLLTEQFDLAVHRESKLFDGYALVIAKGGPKLQTASAGQANSGSILPNGIRFMNCTMENFAGGLRYALGKPVIDKTGVEGNYVFDFQFAPTQDGDSTLPSLVTVLQEKYGLKLEPAKIPLDLIYIDRIQKTPAEN